MLYIDSGLKRQQNILVLNFRLMVGICPGILPYFLSRELLDSVVFSPFSPVAGWCPIGFALSMFVYFLAVVVCIVFFVLAYWLSVSLSLWVLIRNKKMSPARFSFTSLSCIYSSAGLM